MGMMDGTMIRVDSVGKTRRLRQRRRAGVLQKETGAKHGAQLGKYRIMRRWWYKAPPSSLLRTSRTRRALRGPDHLALPSVVDEFVAEFVDDDLACPKMFLVWSAFLCHLSHSCFDNELI
jgi:hypothetical protein